MPKDYEAKDNEIIDKLIVDNPKPDLYIKGSKEYIKILEGADNEHLQIIKDLLWIIDQKDRMINLLANNVEELGGKFNETVQEVFKIHQADLDRGDVLVKNAEKFKEHAEFFREQAAQSKKVANKRGDSSRRKTASKHDRVREKFKELRDAEGLSEKAAIREIQKWIDAENINSGGYDEPYLKDKILKLK